MTEKRTIICDGCHCECEPKQLDPSIPEMTYPYHVSRHVMDVDDGNEWDFSRTEEWDFCSFGCLVKGLSLNGVTD